MSEEEKNNFVPLMDLITTNDISQNKQEKIIDINEISETNNAETLDEDDSKEKLNSDYNINLLDVNNSGIIQIPNSYIEEQKQSYNSDEIDNANTLDESILKTIKRDMKSISYKLKYFTPNISVPNPEIKTFTKSVTIHKNLFG